MKAYDHKFSENEIKQLQFYRDRQEGTALKQRFEVLPAVALYPDGIGAGIEYSACCFRKMYRVTDDTALTYGQITAVSQTPERGMLSQVA